jgi:hypothetical protein
MWKKPEQRQKVAEIFQISQQLVLSKIPPLTPLVTFSKPLTIDDLGGGRAPAGGLLQAITEQALILLNEH